MKESKTLADNVVIRQLQREVLLSIKGLYQAGDTHIWGISPDLGKLTFLNLGNFLRSGEIANFQF